MHNKNLFNINNITEEVISKYYHTTYPNKTIFPNYHIPRFCHGAMHAVRSAILVKMMANIYNNCMPPAKDDYGNDIRFCENEIEKMQIVALLHDSGRMDEGPDKKEWEEQSAKNCAEIFRAYFPSEDCRVFSNAIITKDNEQKSKYAELLKATDSLEVIRDRKPENYDVKLFDLYKKGIMTEVELKNLENKYREFLISMHDTTYMPYNFEGKWKLEFLPNIYEEFEGRFYKNELFSHYLTSCKPTTKAQNVNEKPETDEVLKQYEEHGLLISLCDVLLYDKPEGVFHADYLKSQNLPNYGNLGIFDRTYASSSIVKYKLPCKMFLSHKIDNFLGVILDVSKIEILAAAHQDAWLDNKNLFFFKAPKNLTQQDVLELEMIKDDEELLKKWEHLIKQKGEKEMFTSHKEEGLAANVRYYLLQKRKRKIDGVQEKYLIGMEAYKDGKVNQIVTQNRGVGKTFDNYQNNIQTMQNVAKVISEKDEILKLGIDDRSQYFKNKYGGSNYTIVHRYPELLFRKISQIQKDNEIIKGLFLRLNTNSEFGETVDFIFEKHFADIYIMRKYRHEHDFYFYDVNNPGGRIENITKKIDKMIEEKLNKLSFEEKSKIERAEYIYNSTFASLQASVQNLGTDIQISKDMLEFIIKNINSASRMFNGVLESGEIIDIHTHDTIYRICRIKEEFELREVKKSINDVKYVDSPRVIFNKAFGIKTEVERVERLKYNMELIKRSSKKFTFSPPQNGKLFTEDVQFNYTASKACGYNMPNETTLASIFHQCINSSSSNIGKKIRKITNDGTLKYLQLLEAYLAMQVKFKINVIDNHKSSALIQLNLTHEEITALGIINEKVQFALYIKEKKSEDEVKLVNTLQEDEKKLYDYVISCGKFDKLSLKYLKEAISQIVPSSRKIELINEEEIKKEIERRCILPEDYPILLYGANSLEGFYSAIKRNLETEEGNLSEFRQKQFFLWRMQSLGNELVEMKRLLPERINFINKYLKDNYKWSLNEGVFSEISQTSSSSTVPPFFKPTASTIENKHFRVLNLNENTKKREGYNLGDLPSRLQYLDIYEKEFYKKRADGDKLFIEEGRDFIKIDNKKQLAYAKCYKDKITYSKIVSENSNLPQIAGLSGTLTRMIALMALVGCCKIGDEEMLNTIVHASIAFMIEKDHSLPEILGAATCYGLMYKMDQNLQYSLDNEITELYNLEVTKLSAYNMGEYSQNPANRFNLQSVALTIQRQIKDKKDVLFQSNEDSSQRAI